MKGRFYYDFAKGKTPPKRRTAEHEKADSGDCRLNGGGRC